MDQIYILIGCNPQAYTKPFENSDHPEIYPTEEWNDTGIMKYQTISCWLQWVVLLGQFDTQPVTTKMSQLLVAP
jgi:hypothetical protein